ncbi:MAG: ATP-binding protein [Anaerolineae bacterium]|nr:ATP-binding protein [Anaerolineae bacterium]
MSRVGHQPQLSELIVLPPGFARASVLLISGQADEAIALRQQLVAGGYTVLDGATPARIRQALFESAADVAIIACLPDDQAWEMCALIKRDETAFVPVILVGALPAGVCETEEVARSGPDVVLDVWPHPADLQRTLHTLLRIKQQTDRRYQHFDTDSQRFERIKASIIDRVSHELSTPLLIVKSAVALLAEDVYSRPEGDEQGLAQMATQSVARLENLVSNIRQLARTHHIIFSLVHIEESADYALRQLERAWASQGDVQRVTKHLPVSLPPVYSDKFALGHLLQILLDNALRYSPSDAPVRLYAEQVENGEIVIGVQDFGEGISPDELKHIFLPFYKVNNATSHHQRGAGTGLALAGLLAASMRTAVEVRSTLGEGSLFWFRLPAVALADQADQAAERSAV